MIAERRYAEAERVARGAARIFERAGRQCLLAEALINGGIAAARQGKTDQAQYALQKAIELAQAVDALNLAGIAALTLIEELDDLPPQTLAIACERANEWLADSQSPELLRRMNAAAIKVLAKIQAGLITEDTEALANKTLNLRQELLRYEGALIKRALAQENGSPTRTARNLSMTYQKLNYILATRHKELLTERTPIRRRAAPAKSKAK